MRTNLIIPTILILFSFIGLSFARSDLILRTGFFPVSISILDDNRFIVADYKDLYIISRFQDSTTIIKRLPIVFDSSVAAPSTEFLQQFNRETSLNPTGVHVDRRTNAVWVADYNGHDVLQGQIEGNPAFLRITKRITHADMRSPENVRCDGNQIFVADYDSGLIFAFDLDGALQWKQTLALAHDVIPHGEHVYALGLSDTKVVKLDRRTGAVEAKLAGTDLLYPTSVAVDGDHLLVMDANRGALTALTFDLRVIGRQGSNGPLREQFHRPYGVAIASNGPVVADTLNSRVVFLDRDGRIRDVAVLGSFVSAGTAATFGDPTPYCSDRSVPTSVEALLKDVYGLDADLAMKVGYQVVCVLRGREAYTDILLPYSSGEQVSPFRPTIRGYAWMEEFDGDVIIGSPEDSVLAVYRPATGSSAVAFLPPGFRFWGPDNSPETIFIRALAKRARDRTERIACGNPLVRYIETTLPNAKLGLDVEAGLKFLLHTPRSGELVALWSAGGDPRQITGDWRSFGPLTVDDAIIVHLMVGTSLADAKATIDGCRASVAQLQ
jgi:DNA-binding beta-propeller fold protein YncE